APGTNAGSDELHARGKELAQACDLQRGANEAAQTGARRQEGEPFNLFGGRSFTTNLGKGSFVHARQDRHSEHERNIASGLEGGLFGSLLSCAHHVRTPSGMNGEHLHVEPDGGGDSLRNGVWNVVELEVEEDRTRERADLADDVRTG